MEELVELIVDKYDGSLKAEHGTGVNMAPYVEREWGEKATEMMWRVKGLADPHGILNPGVVLNREPGVHLQAPEEPAARSSGGRVTASSAASASRSARAATRPRRPASGSRSGARWRASREGSPVYEALLADYEYDAIQTCAADGTCQDACPVAIDTGELMKEFRRRERTDREEAVALALAQALRGRRAGRPGGLTRRARRAPAPSGR